jgi:hypothetical protein
VSPLQPRSRASKPAVSVRHVHAEPASELTGDSAIDREIGWLALWPDLSVSYHANALALVRAVRRRDRRDAARADRQGRGALVVTVTTWSALPPGFVPPTESPSWRT